MAGPPTKISTPSGPMLLVRARDVLRPASRDRLRAFVAEALSETGAEREVRSMLGVGDDVAPEVLAELLVEALWSGQLRVVRMGDAPRRLDAPDVVDLRDLVEHAPPPEPIRESVATWFEARVVDDRGRPLPDVQVRWSADGEVTTSATNERGVTRIEPTRARSATLTIQWTSALGDALARAWSETTDAPPLHGESDLHVVHERDEAFGPLLLSAGRIHTVSVQPFVLLGRLLGMFFDTDRDFLLPPSKQAVEQLRLWVERSQPSEILVVGHTDTTGQAAHNEALSLRRAETVRDLLVGDVDAWLARYQRSGHTRWGEAEDALMLESLPDAVQRSRGEQPVRWFQRTRGLVDDGIAGPQTRRRLIEQTMERAGIELSAGVGVSVHGCGEAFPVDKTGASLDTQPADNLDDPIDRRVELFFFGGQLGVLPAPDESTSSAGSAYYPTWRARASEVHEQVVGAEVLEIELVDDDGAPIPEQRYTVRLGVGSVFEGQLDEQGRATIRRLAPGPVWVDFPDLERGAELQSQEGA